MFYETFGETRHRGWTAGMLYIMAEICMLATERIPGSFLVTGKAVAVCAFLKICSDMSKSGSEGLSYWLCILAVRKFLRGNLERLYPLLKNH